MLSAVIDRDKNENENQNQNHLLYMLKEDNLFDGFGEDQRSLEAKYLTEMRDYDTRMIQFDYERRSLRRRRQALLDKQRSLQKREKILGLVSQNSEKETQISPQDQEIILLLRKKLDVVQAEIDYHNSLFLTLSKNHHSQKKMNIISNHNHEDSNYYFLSLKQQERDLLEKKNSIDSRQIEARRILSEPIDDIRLEELLINDIEEDAELVENQYNAIAKKDDYENLNQILIQLDELEDNNRQRKKYLTSKKYSVEQEMRIYSSKKPSFTRKSPSPQKQLELNNSYSIRKDKVSQIINNICNSLDQRHKKLVEEEKKIDELDIQNKRKRTEVEKQWNKKLIQIKTQKSQIREKEKLKLTISDITEKIENDRHIYQSLYDKKKKIKRRIKTILRDKDYNSMKNAEHQTLVASLSKKREKLVKIDEQLKKRTQEFQKQEIEIKKKEKQLLEVEERVNQLEQEVTELQKKNDNKIKQIQESTAQFEASRLAYLTKIKDESIF